MGKILHLKQYIRLDEMKLFNLFVLSHELPSLVCENV